MISQDQFIHHVYFWLKDPADPASHSRLLEGIRSLGAITAIDSYHIGVPAGTNREVIETTYAFSWLAVFDSKEAQDAYQVDPIHLQFVADCSILWEKVVVYDSVGAY